MAQELSDKARQAEEAGDRAEAVRALQEAVDVDPADVASRLNLARLYREAGRTEDAVTILQEVVALTPDDAQAWFDLGEMQYGLGRDVAANESFEQALKYNPRMIPALILKGELEERRRYDDQALELYYRALAYEPNHVEAMLRIARIQMRKNEPIRAALLLRSICQCRDADEDHLAESRWLLGLAYGQQHRWEDAASSLRIAMELNGKTSPDNRYYLAYAQYKAGEISEAKLTAEDILKDSPDHFASRRLAEALGAAPASPTTGIARIGYRSVPPLPRIPPAPAGWD